MRDRERGVVWEETIILLSQNVNIFDNFAFIRSATSSSLLQFPMLPNSPNGSVASNTSLVMLSTLSTAQFHSNTIFAPPALRESTWSSMKQAGSRRTNSRKLSPNSKATPMSSISTAEKRRSPPKGQTYSNC